MYEEYLKTIYWLAELYNPIFHLTNSEWNDFANYLLVDVDCLIECINKEKRDIEFNSKEYNCAPLFDVLIKTFICIESIKRIIEIEDNTDNDSIREVYLLFDKIITWLTSLNADLATFMCMKDGSFSTKYAVQEWKNTNYHDNIWFLTNYMNDELFSLDANTLQIYIKSIKYDIETRLNSIYYTGVLLLIDNSPFIKDEIKSISKDFYHYLIVLLKNCRLIGMKLNLSGPQEEINSRGRINNTTQVLMVYGYDNYDTYCLRLDLPHKGIEFIHYNNRSPGSGNNEVESCIFSKEEYNVIIERYSEFPSLNELFVKHGNTYALKERCNCNFSSIEIERIFDSLEKSHGHIKFSEKKYDEKSILEFIELLSYFYESKRETIQSDEYVINCFNYDRIMLKSKCLMQCMIHRELTGEDYKIDKQIESIVKTAIRYGIIEQCDEPYDIEDVKIIIEYTEDRIDPILR